MFRLNKSISKAQSWDDAEREKVFSKETSYAQRLREANYLIAQAFNFPIDNPPKMNKNIFSSRKHK